MKFQRIYNTLHVFEKKDALALEDVFSFFLDLCDDVKDETGKSLDSLVIDDLDTLTSRLRWMGRTYTKVVKKNLDSIEEESKSRLEKFCVQTDEQTDLLDRLQADLENENKTFSKVDEQTRKLQLNLEEKKKQVLERENQNQEIAKEIEEEEEKYKALFDNWTNLRQDNQNTQIAIGEYKNDKIPKEEQRQDELQKEQQDLDRKYTEYVNKNDALSEKIHELSTKLTSIKQSIEENERIRVGLEQEYKHTNMVISKLQAEIQDYEKKLEELKIQNDSFDKVKQEMQQKYRKPLEENKKKMQVLKKILGNLSEDQVMVEILKEKKIQNEFSARMKQIEDEIEQYRVLYANLIEEGDE